MIVPKFGHRADLPTALPNISMPVSEMFLLSVFYSRFVICFVISFQEDFHLTSKKVMSTDKLDRRSGTGNGKLRCTQGSVEQLGRMETKINRSDGDDS